MKIGVFGGSFDPPHNGHLALARSAVVGLDLDEIIFIPNNRNPLKPNAALATGEERMEMLKRLIADDPKFALSDMELTRGGPSYAVDTLSELMMVQPGDYWFLLGTDAIKELPKWKNPHRLSHMCRFGVVVRPPITDADVMMHVPEEFKRYVDVVQMQPVEVASSQIRLDIKIGKDVSKLVPTDVLRYIQQKKLYKN